jgi:hypothetical protein
VLFTACPGEDDSDDILGPNNNIDIPTTTEKQNDLAKISLVSKNGMTLKVKYEIKSNVDYYYCGKGANISEKYKKYETTTITYDELKPGQEYTFTMILYTKDGKRKDLQASFSTSSSPYLNYVCINGDFYEFTSLAMNVVYGNSYGGTGANWKYLRLYISDNDYVIFRYSVHEWDPISSDWGAGTYKIENGSYYTYGGSYIKGSRTYGFDEGKLTIKRSNGSTVLDFDCIGDYWSKNFVGHAVIN